MVLLRSLVIAAGASLAGWAVSGCGMGSTSAGPLAVPQIRGSVHGGQQPVAGATIQLFAAGTTGYGTGAVSLLRSPVVTDSGGNFIITGDYTCPSATSELYIVATGGNPGLAAGTNNAALALMAALGSCQLVNGQYVLNPSMFISLNEVTTVASVYALAPFMSPTTSQVGTSVTNGIGLSNAFATVNNLVNISTGQALGTTPAGNGTLPQAEINSLADIVAACINSDGTGAACVALQAAATPPGGVAPTNTIQGLLDIAQHPANNVAALYAIGTATGPFQPTLSTPPNDWTIGVTYAGGAMQGGLAVDAAGDVWVSNYFTSSTNLASSLTEFSSTGQVLSGPAGFTGGGLAETGEIAIDPAGNVWEANGGSNLTKFSSAGTPLSPAPLGFSLGARNLASDGQGDIWLNGVREVDNNANLIFTSAASAAGELSLDSSQNVWVAVPSSLTGRYPNQTFVPGAVFKFSHTGALLSPSTGYAANSLTYAQFIATDAAGDAWVASRAGAGGVPNAALTEIAPDGTILSGSNGYTDASLTDCQAIVVDGDGKVWVAYGSAVAPYNRLVTLNSSGQFLSGPTGYAIPSLSFPIRLDIDSSGNLWAAMSSNFVNQMIGVAAPVETPLSVAVRDAKVATRP